jgi:hypothetical protein
MDYISTCAVIARLVENSMSDTYRLMQVACPRHLIAATKRAAAERYLSLSDYVRGAVLNQLRHDGVPIQQPPIANEAGAPHGI